MIVGKAKCKLKILSDTNESVKLRKIKNNNNNNSSCSRFVTFYYFFAIFFIKGCQHIVKISYDFKIYVRGIQVE